MHDAVSAAEHTWASALGLDVPSDMTSHRSAKSLMAELQCITSTNLEKQTKGLRRKYLRNVFLTF